MFVLRFGWVLCLLGAAVAGAKCATERCNEVPDEAVVPPVLSLLQTSVDFKKSKTKGTITRSSVPMQQWQLFPEGQSPLLGASEDSVASTNPMDECTIALHTSDPEASLTVSALQVGSPGFRDGSILILPGDGGSSLITYVNSIGFSAFMLNYRSTNNLAANIVDTQRALSLIRSRASEFGLNASRVGIASFGGSDQIAAAVSTTTTRMYFPIDEVDHFPVVPDFSLMMFGTGNPSMAMNAPPTFLAMARNDPCATVAQVMEYYSALLQNGKPHELHISSGTQGHLSFADCFEGGDFQAICSWPISAQLFVEQLLGFKAPSKSYPFGVTGQ